MERSTPTRKPRRSTADLLTWSEVSKPSSTTATVSGARSHQPSDKISKVLHGAQLTKEEADSLMKKKPCSGYKLKEITGNGIFAANGKGGASEAANHNNRSGLRTYQQAVNRISQISFSVEESISPKKPTSIPEVAKQRELSGTFLQSESDTKSKKQLSGAKTKELSGHDIFASPPEIVPRSVASARTLESKESKDMRERAPRNVRTSVKVSNPAGVQSNMFSQEPAIKSAKKTNNQKFAELTGNNIFKGDVPPGSAEKPLSRAKLREMSGSNIFADGKSASRDYLGGVRKPPGGESSIALL